MGLSCRTFETLYRAAGSARARSPRRTPPASPARPGVVRLRRLLRRAAVVFPALFFPESDPLTGALLAFSTYAVGYLSRPVGGIVFGRLGDKIGRKKVLVITLLLVGIATFLIGVLPTYGAIGPLAAVILVLLRFAQGVGVGGEWGGAVLLSSEFGTPRRRGFWASAAQVGPPAETCWPTVFSPS